MYVVYIPGVSNRWFCIYKVHTRCTSYNNLRSGATVRITPSLHLGPLLFAIIVVFSGKGPASTCEIVLPWLHKLQYTHDLRTAAPDSYGINR